MKPRAGSKALIREINEALVLDIVRAHGPVARATIATRTGLSAATVTGITAKLLQSGLLTESDMVRGAAGRPARLLELGGDTVLAAGVRLSSTEVYVVLVNLRGEVVASHQEPLGTTTRQDVAKTIAQAVGTATARHGSAALIGVGVAVSGVVDHAGGMVRHSGSLGWEGVPLRAVLSETLDVPVVIDSYVNCVAAGLLLFDTVLAGRDLLIFSVGPSLGASVVVQGRIHRGWNGAAGGFAHSRVGGDRGAADRPCHCGAVNCLETFSSHWGIVRELERRLEPTGDLAERDDEVIAEAAETLGTAMANASKMLGPEHVVAAFTKEMNLPVLAGRAEAAFRHQYHHENTPAPDLEFTSADRPALARGAAYVVLARMFTADLTGTGTHAH
ncbi:ROK family transcriptional regulator [Streptomyces poriferorum]|uniref:ROK family transcriptional regulator n=1 Tax=Streptomyces poriferorum TaxID=2798799 RepID=A0ABY9ILJ0_9ACTN|nr:MULTISPECIES: ROK family transcriptional regulator [unclassified Streptomyces]MDP5316980.1 ROK family transcriptional regulator [Streptomyces sp. Alt4]WLQ55259.1 ROK family transcriptional regulator [Streptomyces sp. Alt2]